MKSVVDGCVKEKLCIRNVLEKMYVYFSFTAAGLLTGFIMHNGISCTHTRDCTVVPGDAARFISCCVLSHHSLTDSMGADS